MNLTKRECQIVKLVAEGMRNKQIGEKLGLAEDTVKNYLRTIFDKTGTWFRLELALWFVKNETEEKTK